MRIASMLAAGALAVTGLVAVAPEAMAGPGFDIRSNNNGVLVGHAEAGGQIAWWPEFKAFHIRVSRVANICFGRQGAQAQVWYQTRIGNEFSEWKQTSIADTTRCSDGDFDHGTWTAFPGRTVGAVRVIVRECVSEDDCSTVPNDYAYSDWKWNPDR
jgi:hypothetical protein